MSIQNERSYYNEQDIAATPPGYLRVAKVLSYDTGVGTCIFNYDVYTFINPNCPDPSVDDSIVIAVVEKSHTKLMIASWEGIN